MPSGRVAGRFHLFVIQGWGSADLEKISVKFEKLFGKASMVQTAPYRGCLTYFSPFSRVTAEERTSWRGPFAYALQLLPVS